MNTEQVRQRNDQVRKGNGIPGVDMVNLTRQVAHMTYEKVSSLLRAIAEFTDFTSQNDPHEEHDFGSVEMFDEKFQFKIDRYDKDLIKYGTERFVMTVMLAEEY